MHSLHIRLLLKMNRKKANDKRKPYDVLFKLFNKPCRLNRNLLHLVQFVAPISINCQFKDFPRQVDQVNIHEYVIIIEIYMIK